MIWEQTADVPHNWKMLPDGHLDLIFKFDEKPWKVYSETYIGKSYNPTENFCFLSGLHTKPINVSLQQTHVIGVRLHAFAVRLIFGFPCASVVDWSVNGDDILSAKLAMIEDRLQLLPDFITRARWLEDLVLSLVCDDPDLNTVLKISTLLDNVTTSGQACDIYSHTGYSRMHTHRIFKKWFGLPPAQAIALKRFVHTLDEMHLDSPSLTQLAHTNGYYDQSHFIHVFKEYAAMTPGAYLKNKTDIVGQLHF